MSGLHEVDCGGCGRRHVTSAEQARSQRVLRCECGQFVRLDRALVELRSEPAPAPPPAPAPSDDEDDEDEQTHMLSSLSAVAALRGRATQTSLHGEQRVTIPPPRATLRSLSPAQLRPSDPPPGEKPLWYVDLGGSETVEMTIEQLIIARRSGKLGEGALVWREGMPRWRPVGTLIPAASVASRATPAPFSAVAPPAPTRSAAPRSATPSRPPPPPSSAAPSRPPMPSRVPEELPQPLGSYERPLATLEFALEKPLAAAAPSNAPPVPPGASRRSAPPPRSLTPVPQPQTWASHSALKPLPASALEPVHAPPTPPAPPARSAPPVSRQSLTAPSAPVSFASDQLGPAHAAEATALRARPRWVSACIALALCAFASSAGAMLVRSLKLGRAAPVVASTTAVGEAPSSAQPSKPSHTTTSAAAPASAPLVVNLESLSVEPKRRAVPRAQPAASKPPVPVAPNGTSDDNASGNENEAPAPAEGLKSRPKNSDLPPAAHANPYTTGSDESGS